MSIALLYVISKLEFPLILDGVDEVLGAQSLIEGGLARGEKGWVDITPNGQIVVVRPAVIRGITALGWLFLSSAEGDPDPAPQPE